MAGRERSSPASAVDANERPPAARVSPNGLDKGRPVLSVGVERGLVTRASRGDVVAFSRLVDTHSDLVRRVALRMLGSQDVQDASQEVWVRVWANMKSFRGESAFSTWLHRVTVNTCFSFRQRRSRREDREIGEEMPDLSEPSADDGDPEVAAMNSERRVEMRVALSSVRAEHRAALVLRHVEGLSYAEIAEVLGVPDGTVKGWASRGRAAMLVVLAKESAKGELAVRSCGPGRESESAGRSGHCRRRLRPRVDAPPDLGVTFSGSIVSQ